MSAIIRAKMYVNTVSLHDYGGETKTEEVTLSAVTSSVEGSANKQWAKYTPSGQLKMSIDNPLAQGRMKPGQYFYVDLIPCEKESL